MTPEKIGQVFDLYIDYLEKNGYKPIQIEDKDGKLAEVGLKGLKINNQELLNHTYWMCLQGKELVEGKRIEKAFRWLGFVQGWLTALGVFSIYEVKLHNKPEGE